MKLKNLLLVTAFLILGLFSFSNGHSQENKTKSKTLGNADFGASETPKKTDDYSSSATAELLKWEAESRPQYHMLNRVSIRNGVKTTVVGQFRDKYRSINLEISDYPDSPLVTLIAHTDDDHVFFVLSPKVLARFMGLLDVAINHQSETEETNTLADHASSAVVDVTANGNKEIYLFFKDTDRKEAFLRITKDSAKVLKEFLLAASPYQTKEPVKPKTRSKK